MHRRSVFTILLAICILFAAIPLLPANAQQNPAPQARGMPYYDVAAAVAYAKAHAFDGVGECAQFVSTCLSVGGIEVTGSYFYYSMCEPRYWGSEFGEYTNPSVCSSALLRWLAERYTVITEPKHSDMELGDVILMYGSGNPDGHAGIITGFDGDMPLYCAHNDDAKDDPVKDLANFLVKMRVLKAEGTCTGEHIKGEYLWYSASHPHYIYYTCALCGETYTDGMTRAVASCDKCTTMPEAPILYIDKAAYLAGKTAEITWSKVDCATAYRLRIYKDGALLLDKNMWLTTGYSLDCDAAARYTVIVSATNRAGAAVSGRGVFNVHSYTGTKSPPTCTQQGYTTYSCVCGASYTASYVPALGHNWDNGVVTIPPTPLQPGEKQCTCTRCPATATMPVEPLGLCEAGEACAGNQFTDMPAPNAWSHEGIEFAYHRGLFEGTAKMTFSPNKTMTRAMLVTVLWRYDGRAEGVPTAFTDVQPDRWYTDAADWAAESGIVKGVSETLFDPNGIISREQLAVILFRYCEQKGITVANRADFSTFPDAASVSPWAKDAMQWAVAAGLITGTRIGSTLYLDPQGGATRAQVALILMRFCNLLEPPAE